jgi:EAL domain-containing protein (putative c-di-GMP-specific phosphodiesterase class I)
VSVTAEGVEQPEQAALLRLLGCPAAQGWLYSKAIPPNQIDPLLDTTYPCVNTYVRAEAASLVPPRDRR